MEKMSEYQRDVVKLTPSQYLRLCQMKMSPEEVLGFIRLLWANIKSEKECDEIERYIYMPKTVRSTFPFVPSLPVIVLRAREINSIELRPISFRNDDTIPHGISVAPPENASFKIISPLNYRQKVAPGMCLIFQLQFEVLNCEDYYTEIHCSANGKLLVIPVFAIGPRAYLDLPDSITFPPCPVKYLLNKTLIVRNIGERVSRFTLSTLKKKSFNVNPEQCVIPINGTLQIEVEFNPQFEGESNDELLIHYETGERVYLQLQGTSENINIRLGKNTIPLHSTYIGLKSVRQLSLINSSDISCQFKWSKFATREEEEMRSLSSTNNEAMSLDVHDSNQGVIQIEPMDGEVWQKTDQIFNIIFAPEDNMHYEVVMYCDVVGREVRLPVKIYGEGKGPSVRFVTSKLDVGKILVGIQKNYEVILKNEGLIAASFQLRPSKSLFGRYFKFTPESDVIKQDKTRVINITIQCPMLGDFYEEFLIDIEKSRAPLKLIINGSCIGPTLAFESRKINLGHVALGFPTTKLIDLENKSLIPVRFHLRVIEDNTEKNNLSDSDSRSFENAFLFDTILGKSTEIKIKPDTSNIEPQSSIKIELKLVSQVVKHYKYYLIVDIQGVGKAVTSVSIFAKSEIPKLSVVDNNITFERCFLDYPYEQTIRLKNESDVPAVYRIKFQPASVEKLSTIRYTSSQPEGIIEPLNISSIPITIVPKAIGVLQEAVYITVTGQSGSQLCVPIKCTVCGPVVDVQPEFMDWGMVPVLQLTNKTIQIINLSPIPARVSASMVNLNSVWKLDPTNCNVPPNSTTEITIFAYFQDTQKFQDKVIVKIMHSVTFQIPVWVKTFGTTIGIEPPIADRLILSPHFSNVLLEKRFTIINHGRKSQQLHWSSETLRRDKSCADGAGVSIFHLIPAMMELSPGQSMEFILQALSDKPQKVMEVFSCYGTKGRTKNKEMVMQFEVHMEFIAPSLRYSTTELTFKVCKEKNKDLENLVTPLSVTNVSALPLTVNIVVIYPFQILLDGNVFASHANIVIPVGHSSKILINFDPNYVNDKVMRSVKEELKVSFLEHPQVDIIPLNGFVYFANLLFDKTEIEFKIMPIGLEWRQTLCICNTSPFQVYYNWSTYITSYDASEIHSAKDCQKFLSILPMQGVLHPGDEQEVTVLFNAESKVTLEGIALCEVDDGPSYPVRFVAQAAELSYDLFPTYIVVGNQVFNEVINVKVTLANKGDVGFRFSGSSYPLAVDSKSTIETSDLCNFSLLIPTEGFIDAHETQVLNIKILPVYPWSFKYEVCLEIAHFEPRRVTVVGHSVFPFIGVSVDEGPSNQVQNHDMRTGFLIMNEVITCISTCLVELKKEPLAENERDLKSVKSTLNHCFDGYDFAELIIDFGFIILGSINSKVISVFNRSNLPISFKLEVEKLNHSGFYVDIDQVKQLPPLQSVSFLLTFNPFTANIPLGEHTLRTFIKVSNGIPTGLLLRAIVTKPKMALSPELVEFGEVQCSHCKVVTIQMYNDGFVPCEWECIHKKPNTPKARKTKHHGILNLIFFVHPPNGFLRPKEKMNLEIHFIPHEDKVYTERLIFKIRKSSIIPAINVKGTGVEPHIFVRPQVNIFDPVLPNSRGCEKEVIIENACNFSIEMYSVEFDKQFIEEDMYIRLLPNYDDLDSTLIPVRQPGEKFPSEFYKYFTEILSKTKTFLYTYVSTWQTKPSSQEVITDEHDADSVLSVNTIIKEAEAIENCRFNDEQKMFIHKMSDLLTANEKALLDLPYDTQEKLIAMVHKFFNELDLLGLQDVIIDDPAQTSINTYLAPIKFPNGVMEESINYLTIIIFGPPKTDDLQSEIVSALADHYKTKPYTIDTVVQEAIVSGESQAALAAREFCRKKAAEAKSKVSKYVTRVQKDGSLVVLNISREEPVRASVVTMQIGDEELAPTYLPHAILSEVIGHHIRGKGYESGLIIASLDCNFCPTTADTISAILTAFSKKKHLYFISLHKTFSSIKENETKNKIAEALQNKMKLKDEVNKVENMSEDEYNSLSLEKKLDVDHIINTMKSEWFQNKRNISKERRASQVVDRLKSKKSLLRKMDITIETLDEISEASVDDQVLNDKFTEYENDFQGLIGALVNFKPYAQVPASKEQLEISESEFSETKAPESIEMTPSQTFSITTEEPKVATGFPHLIANISTITDPNIIVNAILTTLPTMDDIQEEIQNLRNNVFCPPPYLLSVLIFPFQTRMPIPSIRFDYVGHALVTDKIDSGDSDDDENTGRSLFGERMRSTTFLHRQTAKYSTTRWIIPPRAQMSLRIRFKSADMGQFDRILHLELLGSRRRYQVFCRGTCRLPDIHREPSTLFDSVKKTKRENEISDKVYILDTKIFEYGPLLLGKPGMPNDSLRNQNTSVWNIVNSSGMTVDITFSLTKPSVFQLEPTNLVVAHGSQEKLRVIALPMEEGEFEAEVVFSIKDNPDLHRVQVSCIGANPIIELEPTEIQFNRVLLHRREFQSIKLINKSMLPVFWKLNPLNCGDEFIFPVANGILLSDTTSDIKIGFQSSTPTTSQNSVHIEMYDVNNSVGLMQTESLFLSGEAYDVAVDLVFPRGCQENVLDFGYVRVREESKLNISLKNKGKYDILYKFVFLSSSVDVEYHKILNITPLEGKLAASDKNVTTIQFTSKCKKELSIAEIPLAMCKLIEPNMVGGSGTVAEIPIKVNLKALYSRFKLRPENGLNFGSVVVRSMVTRTFYIGNTGPFNFTFDLFRDQSIDRMLKGEKSQKLTKTPDGELILNVDKFTVTPYNGTVPVGQEIAINVGFSTEEAGKFTTEILINIGHTDSYHDASYPIIAQVCVPTFESKNLSIIFEEHPICDNESEAKDLLKSDVVGVYCQANSLFTFRDTMLDTSIEAHFKVYNDGKVPSDIIATLTPSKRLENIVPTSFSVQPHQSTILPFDHIFLTVKFHPKQLQKYESLLQVTLSHEWSDADDSNIAFSVCGEGVLPLVAITKPVCQNDSYCLTFLQLLVGEVQELKFQLKNISAVPSMITMELFDPNGSFWVAPLSSELKISVAEELTPEKEFDPSVSSIMDAEMTLPEKGTTFSLLAGETAEFIAYFSPVSNKMYSASVRFDVWGNYFDKPVLTLIGEGCDAELLIKVQNEYSSDEPQDSNCWKQPKRFNFLDLGQCHINQTYKKTVTMINKSSSVARFEWAQSELLNFSPQIAHVKESSRKDITVTFHCEAPISLTQTKIECKVCKIQLLDPKTEMDFWDDRKKVVKWVKVLLDEDTDRTSQESGISEKSKEFIERKRIETEPEPEYELVPNSEQTLDLLIHVQTAYCTFSLDTRTINFENTYVYDKRTIDVCMENTGTILLEGKWNVKVKIDKKSALEMLTSRSTSDDFLSVVGSPISITPDDISIKPGAQQIFQVKFSPLVVENFEGTIFAIISNLLPNYKEARIKVIARSLLPFCHFKLEHSDYITGNRRDRQLRIPPGIMLNSSIKVIEINVSGLGMEVVKSFMIANPTNTDNVFIWQKIESQTEDFTCLTPTGNLHAGMSTQISFKLRSRNIGVTESFWRFILPNVNLVVPFLIAGIVKEPEIFASCSAMNIGPLLKGQSNETSFDLLNHDDCRMDFAFDPESCFTSGRQMHLQIYPMTGAIPPNSRNHIRVNFKAIAAGNFNFTLFCILPKRSTPIKVNVKVTVYEMKLLVYCTSGTDRVEMQPNKQSKVDLGKVNIGEMLSTTVVIVNSGDVGFEYKWSIKIKHNRSSDMIASISPDAGYVKTNESETCMAFVKPNVQCRVERVDFRLKILGGPSYTLSISGEGELPGVTFSSSLVDFGCCFSNISSQEKVIYLTNTHRKSLSVQCLYTQSNTLNVHFETCVVAPQESKNIVFVFTPKMVKPYEEKVSFLINSHITKVVRMIGEGIEMKVAVANFHDKMIKFGALRIGDMKRKTIVVVNSSKAIINRPSFHLSLDSACAEVRDSLTLSGKCALVLEAMRGQCSVDVVFAPKRRVPNFKVGLTFVSGNTRLPISVVTGSCKALEVTLLDTVILFGAVVENTTVERKLLMNNTGDYGTKFHWDELKFFPDFSVSPTSGYITPDSQLSFTLSFHPTKTSHEIKREGLKCYLEQGHVLSINVMGSCIEIPANAKIITFSTPVRKSDRQEITIKNSTSVVWKVHPKINGEFWHMAPVLIIGANENKAFDIVYCPLTMTREQMHQGSVFILLPNGSHLAFNLIGHSLPPTVTAVVTRDIQCRTEFVELLTLENWFPTAHRFKVRIETESKLDSSTFVNGTSFIDVLGNKKKDYKLRFLAYKEVVVSVKVTFYSEETGEYEFYELLYKTYKAGPEDSLQLITTLRTTFRRNIVLKNPLKEATTFSVTCELAELQVPASLTVEAESEVGKLIVCDGKTLFQRGNRVTVEFTPLHLGEEYGWIELISPDLGSFEYEVVTKCTHVAPEKTVILSTFIGMSCTTTVRIPNPFPDQKIEMTIKIDDVDFQVEKASLTIQPGAAEIVFDLSFDPSSLGESRATITLTSPTTGDFFIPVQGTGLPPKAQGPLPVKVGVPTIITIRNPFTFNVVLECTVDNPQFIIAPYPEVLKSRKELKVIVTYDPFPYSVLETANGKVMFNAIREDAGVSIVHWIYYLHGSK